MFYGTQRSTLGALTLDVMLREHIGLPSEVTKYPVEDGGPDVSDHITQGNETLEINGSVSATSMQAFEFSSGPSKLIDAVATLREMHAERQSIKVVTGLGVYEDMAFTGLNITRASDEKGGWWIDIEAELIKIVKVKLEEGELPPEQVAPATKGKTGKTEKKGGSGEGPNSTPPQDAKRKSTFKSVKDKGISKSYTDVVSTLSGG